MLVAILTDIHGNREALSACLDHARQQAADRFVLLGDYVGYGADPAWVVDTVRDLVDKGAVALRGNHDVAVDGSDVDMNSVAREAIRWTRERLDPEQRRFLAHLPLVHEDGNVLYVHANGYAPGNWDYMDGPMEATRHFSRVDAHITFCGHVHVPMLYHMSSTAKVGSFSPVGDNEIPLLPTRTWLAVIGSVGQPRDGVAAANYALFDTARQTLRFLRVPYDTAAAARKVREAGLPEKLALRLERGR
ncbi:metallophosphoesterase [Microvirga sp. 17 mud 1-3]|uniref:metallophosphoesterase family protein n=1 Tax=Microvirga sp. 17 mud 1-3 TaxID=2082949 RepID=UPI000D6D592E|nr:metallophosphoesterase family protein [Microvirga sp. 17 mud 1-3]AWM88761.1 metallophosphatase family protein [Microvirga sp. 17 mud 1-3]